MVLNDVKQDIRVMLAKLDWSTGDLADAVGVHRNSINVAYNRSVRPVKASIVKMLEEMGYDIKLEYVPRDGE